MNSINKKFFFNWVLVNKLSIGTPLNNKDDVNFLKRKKIKSVISLCELFDNEKYYEKFIHHKYKLPDHRDGICPKVNEIKNVKKDLIKDNLNQSRIISGEILLKKKKN